MAGQLLAAGADPNAALKMGETPLMTASRSGNLQIVALLLEKGAKVNTAEDERGQTARMGESAQRQAHVSALLIGNNAYLQPRGGGWYRLSVTLSG